MSIIFLIEDEYSKKGFALYQDATSLYHFGTKGVQLFDCYE